VLFCLPHHLAAMSQRAGSPALNSMRVGIKPDAEQRVAFAGERAKSFEVSQAHKW